MPGGPRTTGFSAKRSSTRASGTTRTSRPTIAWAQKDDSREVSRRSEPHGDLKIWRSASINVIIAVGPWNRGDSHSGNRLEPLVRHAVEEPPAFQLVEPLAFVHRFPRGPPTGDPV